jgi:hypothetical protein
MIGFEFWNWRHSTDQSRVRKLKPKHVQWLERAFLDGFEAGRKTADAELRKAAEIATRELEEMRAEKAKNPFPGQATVVE